jgi:2-keto-4-pentenoate hydratase/2-oxohepta-3-ene-1,7-dioic acid hydratase in catechol pathway
MRLVTFMNAGSRCCLGALGPGGRTLDLVVASAALHAGNREGWGLPATDMLGLIDAGEAGLEIAREAYGLALQMEATPENGTQLWYQPNEIRLLSPLPRPRSFRDFWSFEEHVRTVWQLRDEQVPRVWYEMPTYYKGNAMSIIGPDEDLIWPSYTEKLDYELEMGIIIGKTGRDVPVENAHGHIFGYTVLNDWSARDVQRKEMACRLGPAKGKDFATSLGPCIVTADEVDPYNLRMTASVNGEVWSDNNSGTGYWKFDQLIAHVSMGETLYPGELFGSGTVGGGCGLELDRWLEPSDVVELEIEKIGVLRNRVVRSPTS